jgi:hypothetical protein
MKILLLKVGKLLELNRVDGFSNNLQAFRSRANEEFASDLETLRRTANR